VQVRRATLWITEKILFSRIKVGDTSFTVHSIVLALAGLTFAGACWDTSRAHDRYAIAKAQAANFAKHVDETTLANKFRSERNWWLSLFALTLWLIILRVRQIQEHVQQLEGALAVASATARVGQAQGFYPGPSPVPLPGSSTGAVPVPSNAKATAGSGGAASPAADGPAEPKKNK